MDQIPALALLVIIGLAVAYIIYQISQDAILLAALQNMDPSAALDALRGITGVRLGLYIGAFVAIVVGSYFIYRQGGFSTALNQAEYQVQQYTAPFSKAVENFTSPSSPVNAADNMMGSPIGI